jgi:uncharacterized protein
MLHKQVEATAQPTTEEGKAVLLVAAYTRDRGGDVIQRGAFTDTIAAWIGSGKQIPLAGDHETGKPEQLIGRVDPATMAETRDGLRAEATLDLEGSETAREAWRHLVKSDSIGVSFGYMAEQVDAGNGTRLLTSIDLYEISLTATPMNADAKVVSWKSASNPDPALDEVDERDWRAVAEGFKRADAERAMEVEINKLAAKSHPVRVKTFEA